MHPHLLLPAFRHFLRTQDEGHPPIFLSTEAIPAGTPLPHATLMLKSTERNGLEGTGFGSGRAHVLFTLWTENDQFALLQRWIAQHTNLKGIFTFERPGGTCLCRLEPGLPEPFRRDKTTGLTCVFTLYLEEKRA